VSCGPSHRERCAAVPLFDAPAPLCVAADLLDVGLRFPRKKERSAKNLDALPGQILVELELHPQRDAENPRRDPESARRRRPMQTRVSLSVRLGSQEHRARFLSLEALAPARLARAGDRQNKARFRRLRCHFRTPNKSPIRQLRASLATSAGGARASTARPSAVARIWMRRPSSLASRGWWRARASRAC
jgi:hypothetical protein